MQPTLICDLLNCTILNYAEVISANINAQVELILVACEALVRWQKV